MKIGFTGTRNGMTVEQNEEVRKLLSEFLDQYPRSEFHHGDCVGADTQAHEIAKELGYKIIIHPSTYNTRAWNVGDYINTPIAPLKRNKHIVNETQFMVATPKEHSEAAYGGTWHAIRYATNKRRDVFIVWPSGNITETKPDYVDYNLMEMSVDGNNN